MMQNKAYAKVNLFLHVEKKLPNGYHLINSLVCFAQDIFDIITIVPYNQFELEVLDNKLPIKYEENLVFKAYRLLIENFNIPSQKQNIKITLNKSIPIAAGLGGGSADAALTLKMLSQLWNLDIKIVASLCGKLGADVPVCFTSQSSFMSGIGENISGPISLPQFFMVIINPNKELLTKEVFGNNTSYSSKVLNIQNKYTTNDFKELLHNSHNDLELAASKILPDISVVKNEISKQPGCISCRMSGSGASVIGIFFDEVLAQKATKLLQEQNPSWWVSFSRNL